MRVVAAEMVGPAQRARMDPLPRPVLQVKMVAMDRAVGRAEPLATTAQMEPMAPMARMARTAKPALRGPWEQLAELGKLGSLPQMQT